MHKTAKGVGDYIQHPMVMHGKNGWLFLKNDSNCVIDQIARRFPLDPDFSDKWQRLIEYRKKMSSKLQFSFFMSIIPNKEYVYPEYLPDEVILSEDRPVYIVLKALTDFPHVYLLNCLKSSKQNFPAYIMGDTHWTQHGSLAAFSQICTILGLNQEDIFLFPIN